MRLCKHYIIENGECINLILPKPNNKFVCKQCFESFTKNDYHNVQRFCNIMNMKGMSDEDKDALIRVQLCELPRFFPCK